MEKFGKYVMVKDKEDFDRNWSKYAERFNGSDLVIDGIGEITNTNKNQLVFPLFLEDHWNGDPHWCGYYGLSSKIDFIIALQDTIKKDEEILENHKNFLKELTK